MGNTLFTHLQISNGLRLADEVYIQKRCQRLVIGGREEDLTVSCRAVHPLSMLSLGVGKCINSNKLCIRSNQSAQVSIDAVLTVTERIIPVMDECAYITGFHVRILCGVTASVQSKILPHKTIIVPFVQKSYCFLGALLGNHSVIKAVDVEFFVGDRRINKGFNQVGSSPSDIIAGGERNHLVSVST